VVLDRSFSDSSKKAKRRQKKMVRDTKKSLERQLLRDTEAMI